MVSEEVYGRITYKEDPPLINNRFYNDLKNKSASDNKDSNVKSESGSLGVVRELVSSIIEDAMISPCQPVKMRERKLSFASMNSSNSSLNRHSFVCDNVYSAPPGSTFQKVHKRAISECVIDENDNSDFSQIVETFNSGAAPSSKANTKRKKRLSFNSFFHKKDHKKTKDSQGSEDSETYDDFESVPTFQRNNNLNMSRKYHSALEISTKKTSMLQRTPSLIKRIISIGEESKEILKRSLSFRDVSKKHEKEQRESLSKQKKEEWRQSLKSLVETDLSVSYNDLSFVDYDALNNISYTSSVEDLDNCNIHRSQSMIEKRSPKLHNPRLNRGTSCSEGHKSPNIVETTALSLPSLHHLNRDNHEVSLAETLASTASQQKYLRRPQSICCEDGSRHRLSQSRGSFSSTGSGGCAKLKRHNACRQKSRDAIFPSNSDISHRTPATFRNETVRSRSLNHLDTLEMRQGVPPPNDTSLKDSRSEPDCTRPLLVPAIPSAVLSAAPAASTSLPDPVNEQTSTAGSAIAETGPSNTGATQQHPRKHMLSRSQKSSSECFSVNFEVGDESTWENELFFPAQRGVLLQESLAKMCELRNIDLSACDARLQDKENNTETFLHFTQDTGSLVGKHIRIKAKETGSKRLTGSIHSNHIRKPSGSYRPKTGGFFSSSTEETASAVGSSTLSLHDGDQSKKQIRQMFSSFFANSKDSKYEGLIDQLDKYSKQGVPVNQYYPLGQCESVDALYKLEEDWKDIVEYKDLTDKQQQQQTALWELIKTEVAYIKMLKVVTNLFLSCLQDLQSKNLLKEIDKEKLFSNITEILDANVIFWRNTLFPLVRDMRKYKRPACIENMLEGFASLHEIFQPYFKYCAEQSRCQHYCRDNLDSDVFAAYLTWCESQKDCNRLRLMDILVQPMQRLTKYGLLLKAILKNTDEDVERETLHSMIRMVDEFVNSVNSSLKHKQDKERLKGIIARIESYDIVDSKDDDIERILKKEKSFTQLDLNRPMLNCPVERKRHLLLEGDLKLKDSGASKVEVHCFLLTDMLLICKPSTKKGGATMRVIRQPYLVDRLVVTELNKETPSLALVYKNEFEMAVSAFILQNNDPKKIKGWKEGLAKAQILYAQAKQISLGDDSIDASDYWEYNLESDCHSLQLAPRSPAATSSRASRVSSLAHSHSGSMDMNEQSGSCKDPKPGVSIDNDNRTASISSDEGVQPLPTDKSPGVSQKNSFKNRLFHKTPNTLSVQPYSSGTLGQSLPNLTLGSPNVGSLSLSFNHNTLLVPSGKTGGHLLSPTHRGISYPPPSPTRGNLRRGLAISQSKNPPLIKTRHVNSASSASTQIPTSFDFDVPVIAGVSKSDDQCESFSRGQHRQAMKRTYRNDKRYHTAGVVDDIKKNDNRDASIHKRLSWNCTSQGQPHVTEDHT